MQTIALPSSIRFISGYPRMEQLEECRTLFTVENKCGILAVSDGDVASVNAL